MDNKAKKIAQKIYEKSSTVAFFFQRLRIWSRTSILFYIVMLHYIILWAISLPNITSPQATMISTITGLATPITAFYTHSGKQLYKEYVDMVYTNEIVKAVDHIGFIIDKFRLFPVFFMVYYIALLAMVVKWGIMLGDDLSGQQAAFISSFAGSASIVFGFVVTTGETNMKTEEIYTERYDVDVEGEEEKNKKGTNNGTRNTRNTRKTK